jgi:hypothetical protein
VRRPQLLQTGDLIVIPHGAEHVSTVRSIPGSKITGASMLLQKICASAKDMPRNGYPGYTT